MLRPSRSRATERTAPPGTFLLFDIGNTYTHVGIANSVRVLRQMDLATNAWRTGEALPRIRRLGQQLNPRAVAVCSVVPAVTPLVRHAVANLWHLPISELSHDNLRGVGLKYPNPRTIGPDRLANAIAARHHYGAPAIVIDFGTAVTFDVVDHEGNYIGGVIAPGLAALTEYLHEKTALLPLITIREPRSAVGKSTEEAMRVGAVYGYRGLVREVLKELKNELGTKRLAVVATGGYAKLMAARMPEITSVVPDLTLEGLRLQLV
jgi:type III pantothenate kinase